MAASGKISEIREETVVENGGETPVEDANVEELKEEQMEIVVPLRVSFSTPLLIIS